jgi:hypothetical protein
LLEWLCLVNRTTVEVEWLVPLVRFQDQRPYWLEWLVIKLMRILDGKGESGLMSYSELQGGSPHLCQLSTALVGPCGTSFDYVLTHARFMGVS